MAGFEKAVAQYCGGGRGADAAGDDLQEALGGEDRDHQSSVVGLLLHELERGAPNRRSRALHLLQIAWWPPAPVEAAQHAFAATLKLAGNFEPLSPEAEDAALLLSNIVRAHPGELAHVEAALSDVSPAARRLAAAAAGRIGPAARPLVTKLTALLADPDTQVGDAALESLSALAPISPEATMPALVDELHRANGLRRYLALAAVRAIVETTDRPEGSAAYDTRRVADAVLPALMDPEAAVRLLAVALLGVTGEGMTATRSLEPLIQDSDPAVAAAAIVSLAKLGKVSPDGLALFERLLTSPDAQQRQGAFNALEGASGVTLERLRPAVERAATQGPESIKRPLQALLASVV